MRISWENADVEGVVLEQWDVEVGSAKISCDIILVDVTNKDDTEIEAFKIIDL